jgi:hypothetical protein
MPKNAYSYSALRGFEECPATMLYKRKRFPKEESFALLVGKFAHAGIEEYLRSLRESGLPQDPTIVPDVVRELSADDRTPSDRVRMEVANLLSKFASEFVATTLVEPELELELAFDERWHPVGWRDWDVVRWRAKVDVFDRPEPGVLRVTDWKTGWKIPTREERENDPQLPSYAFCASLVAPEIEEFRLRHYFVRAGIEFEQTFYRDDLSGVRQELEARMRRADQETKFDHRPGPWCGGCFYRKSCPGYRKAGLAETFPEEGDALADLFYLLRAKTADVEAALKERVEREGPVVLSDGRVLNFYPTERWSIDETKLAIGELLEMGVEAERIYDSLSLSKTALGKLVGKVAERGKKGEVVDRLLRSYGSVSHSNRFEPRKPTE